MLDTSAGKRLEQREVDGADSRVVHGEVVEHAVVRLDLLVVRGSGEVGLVTELAHQGGDRRGVRLASRQARGDLGGNVAADARQRLRQHVGRHEAGELADQLARDERVLAREQRLARRAQPEPLRGAPAGRQLRAAFDQPVALERAYVLVRRVARDAELYGERRDRQRRGRGEQQREQAAAGAAVRRIERFQGLSLPARHTFTTL
jgi:hypothetical protein